MNSSIIIYTLDLYFGPVLYYRLSDSHSVSNVAACADHHERPQLRRRANLRRLMHQHAVLQQVVLRVVVNHVVLAVKLQQALVRQQQVGRRLQLLPKALVLVQVHVLHQLQHVVLDRKIRRVEVLAALDELHARLVLQLLGNALLLHLPRLIEHLLRLLIEEVNATINQIRHIMLRLLRVVDHPVRVGVLDEAPELRGLLLGDLHRHETAAGSLPMGRDEIQYCLWNS